MRRMILPVLGLAMGLAAQEPIRRNLDPARVALNLEQAKVTAVLKEISRQIGHEIPLGTNLKNPVLPVFQAEGTFWEVIDQLCQASGNTFRWSDRKG